MIKEIRDTRNYMITKDVLVHAVMRDKSKLHKGTVGLIHLYDDTDDVLLRFKDQEALEYFIAVIRKASHSFDRKKMKVIK